MRILTRIEGWLYQAELALLWGTFIALAFLAFLQVVLRFFSFGFVWADVLLRHLVLWVGFLGAAAAARQERHFAVDALARLLPRKALAVLVQAARAVGAVASLCLSWAAAQFVLDEWRSGSTLFSIGHTHFPSAFFQLILPAGFLLMAFHFAMRLKDPPQPPEGHIPETPA